MKIKTLAIAAATLAVGAISSQAQVYSQNIVGYVNVTIPPSTYVLVNNPLTTGNDVLTNVIPLGNAPSKVTKAYFWGGASWGSAYTLQNSGWSPAAGNVSVQPGQAFFLQNTATTNITVTFTGSVLPGTNYVTCNQGYNVIGSLVPVSGRLQTDLGYPAIKKDFVYQWSPTLPSGGGYIAQMTRQAGSWSPSEPQIGTNTVAGVAEGFFYNVYNPTPEVWTNVAPQ
jgi:hypothetical protein